MVTNWRNHAMQKCRGSLLVLAVDKVYFIRKKYNMKRTLVWLSINLIWAKTFVLSLLHTSCSLTGITWYLRILFSRFKLRDFLPDSTSAKIVQLWGIFYSGHVKGKWWPTELKKKKTSQLSGFLVLFIYFIREAHFLSSSFSSLSPLFPRSTCLRTKIWSDACRGARQSSKHQSNVLTSCALFMDTH